VLTKLGFNDFCVRINHRKALTGILAVAGVASDQHESALIALDKLDKIGREGVEKEFTARGIDPRAGTNLLQLFSALSELEHAADIADQTRQALNKAILGRIVEFVGDNELGAQGVEDLQSILDFAEATGVGNRLQIDPSLARGLSYYTGAIMEINVKDLAGSLAGGGRYDNLVGMFLGHDVPACGLSLGLERILVVMSEKEMFPEQLVSAPAEVMVAIWNDNTIAESLALAQTLRARGLRVDLYPEADKLGKQFKYASSRAIPFVAVIGDDERAQQKVGLKDMITGEQQAVSVAELVNRLRKTES
jgi:histidyl-tRNA synthetase